MSLSSGSFNLLVIVSLLINPISMLLIDQVERIEPLFLGVPVHRVHGDCHLNNLLWSPAGPTFLDFDDMLVLTRDLLEADNPDADENPDRDAHPDADTDPDAHAHGHAGDGRQGGIRLRSPEQARTGRLVHAPDRGAVDLEGKGEASPLA